MVIAGSLFGAAFGQADEMVSSTPLEAPVEARIGGDEFEAPIVVATGQLNDLPLDENPIAPLARQTDVQSLERRINSLQSELSSLRQRVAEDEIVIDRHRSSDVLRADTRQGVPGFPKVQMTGVLQVDSGWFTQSGASVATFGDLQDTTGFRRARLAAMGDVAANASYLVEVDFAAPGRPTFMDMWLDLHDVPLLGNIRIGQWRQPAHMDVQTSARELLFLEPALSSVLVPNRQVGVGSHDVNSDQTATWAASVYRYPTDLYGNIGSPLGHGVRGDRGYGAAARATGLLWYEETGKLVHVGGSYAYEIPGDDVLFFRNTPEFGGPFVDLFGTLGSVPFFVESGLLPTRSLQVFGGELGARAGSVYGQAEVTYASLADKRGGTLLFPGAYGQLAWLVTGEVRPYNRISGVFGRVKPLHDLGKDGWGAWELATRYSYLDLNERSSAGPTTPGGRLADVTIGVNWYWNSFAKLQFNYILATLDRPAVGDSSTSIFGVRGQVDF